MRLGLKAVIAVTAAAITIVVSFYLPSGRQSPDPFFTYASGYQDGGYVQLSSGASRMVPFAFTIDGAASEVALEIKDALFPRGSIYLEKPTVQVKNGKAWSKAVFALSGEQQIKPGSYRLSITARDSASGEVLHTGIIPFMVDMVEVVANCSC